MEAKSYTCPLQLPSDLDPMEELFLRAVACVFRKNFNMVVMENCVGCKTYGKFWTSFSTDGSEEHKAEWEGNSPSKHECMKVYAKDAPIVQKYGTHALAVTSHQRWPIFKSLGRLHQNENPTIRCLFSHIGCDDLIKFLCEKTEDPFITLAHNTKWKETILHMSEYLVFGTYGYQWPPQ